MPLPPVADASPLILFAKANLLDLVHLAGDPILVPRAVAQEIHYRGSGDPAAQALTTTNWLTVVDPGPIAPALHAYRLGAGEAGVLNWALAHPGSLVLIDDLLGRRCASLLGLPMRGSIGLVVSAKQQGAITVARPLLERLRLVGLFVTDSILNQALAWSESDCQH